jgi:hypothetical protein
MSTEDTLASKARRVRAGANTFFELSGGERIAVARILDRQDLLKQIYGSILEAIDRLRPQWTEAALRVQRNGR